MSDKQIAHDILIVHEGPKRSPGFSYGGGHRARCSCGWGSDCYSQMSDTQRAIEVHLRRAKREDFEGLLARSSIGAAVADVKARGIDAHLADLEREMNKRRPAKKTKKKVVKKLSTEDKAFMRGFGMAIASIWTCSHDRSLIRIILKENSFTLKSFVGVEMLDADYAAIEKAVRR